MTASADYYALLQVDPRAEKEVIDVAYRRLASKYHPDVDRSPNAGARMTLLNAAYEVLSDPARRTEYDARRGQTTLASAAPPRRRSYRRGVYYESRHVTIAWLPSLLLLAAIIVATRVFRLGVGETAVILIVAAALWMLYNKR